MSSPTLLASYVVHSASADMSDLVTPTFTPSAGEVLVVKSATWDRGTPLGAVSGGGQAYTVRLTAAPPSGFFGWAQVVTATVSGAPGPMAVTIAGSATNSRHSMVVERWGNGRLAATPAVNSVISGSLTLPSAGITTTADGSVVSWVSADVASVDPATRAYLLSATEDLLFDGHAGGNGVFYGAYALVGAAGAYTMGMTAPANQRWVLAGVEIIGGSVAPEPSRWTVGTPETRWTVGPPRTAWTVGQPKTMWETGVPRA